MVAAGIADRDPVCRDAVHPDVSFAGVLADGGAEVDLAVRLGPGDQQAEDRRTENQPGY